VEFSNGLVGVWSNIVFSWVRLGHVVVNIHLVYTTMSYRLSE